MACDVVCVASWNADLVSRVPRPIGRGETLLASTFEVSPGGKGSTRPSPRRGKARGSP